ncbi:general transcription factor 3C polypeptide 1-like [Macrosteles quadrilineatus]|uniref:general transcription factor 3C polypeptide 1-like n=1 Tax=Macrosteles quadrilineatus TaxID=74068 RepID=UPI0023E24AF6|nr:general transcription factor 3C polypeptide 1-like [Macrosteles quadrilineatus]
MFAFKETPGYIPNFVKGILDEIALEGLDGITPNDLWLRLNNRPFFTIKPNDESARSFLWDAVKQLKPVCFYELPEPRPPLVIFDRFQHIDPELGMIIEPENMPKNIYPHCKVEDPANGIIGSCSTYFTRKDITDEVRSLSYEEVDKRWGHRLVAVASAAARRRALQNPDVNPNLELTPMQYIVLERVGRSRYLGEITQGRDSLQIVGEDAKAIFYLRKVLHKHRLITKQMFHQKLGTQNTSGLLLHLPRFFVERRPKTLTMTEKVVAYLKNKPNHMEEHNVLRTKLNIEDTLKKLSKTPNFQKFIKSDVVLHRVMYPEASESEWKYKGLNKERSVRVFCLIDPSTDPKDVWQKYDDIYDDEDDDKCGLLDEGHRLLDRTVMAQAYKILEAAGPEGVTQVQMGESLGASKLASRMIVRNLTKSNKVTMFMKDEGRQRTAKFALKIFDKCSDIKKQMIEEKDKLIKLVSESKTTEDAQPSCSKNQSSGKQTSNSEKREKGKKKKKEALPSPSTSKATDIPSEVDVREVSSEQRESITVDVTESLPLENNPPASEKIRVKIKRTRKRKGKLDEEKTSEPVPEKKAKIESAKKVPAKVESPGPTDEAFTSNVTVEIKSSYTCGRSLTAKPLALPTTIPGLESTSVTFRMLKRTNLIMEAVHKQKVIFDASKLQKMILEEETKEGLDVRMDKKSLQRIIRKLALEGHVKHLQVSLKGYDKQKTLVFICHPSVDNDHSVIQSAIDQAKMKFHILGREALRKKSRLKKPVQPQPPPPKQPEGESLYADVPPSCNIENFNLKYNFRLGRMYGFKPKYMRMQVLHKYMFYLIYGYEGDVDLNQETALREIENHVEITDSIRSEMSQIYSTTMDWKMFLPPLPVHTGYTNGWALMSDMLLRLPLSLFIQLVNVMYEIPGIEEYLNHPIRKHLLVKNLPLSYRYALTYARKYIFTIHEQVIRLCCTGLLQMGPQRLKEKDQVFVYLNRRALLWDTTSSPCGYHQIDKEQQYPVHHYHLQTLADVEQYWYDLWNFCMHTMLGGRMCVAGKEVVVEGLQNKPEMVEAVESQSVEEAVERDVGYLPGDHLGAAGFDSAMFAHLKRNWYWNTSKTGTGPRSAPAPAPTTDLQPVLNLHKHKEDRKQSLKTVRVISETSSARRRGRRESKSEPKGSQKQMKKKLLIKKTVRMLQNRRASMRKPYYDQVDREALLKMSKLRVDWSPKEDNLLLLCKVAFVIFQNIGKRYQNLITVRQLLHDQYPESTDKTSRACQRRLNYIMKNSQTQRSVNLCVEEMKQDNVVMNQLQGLVEVMKSEAKVKLPAAKREEEWTRSFKELVLLLQERYKKLHSQELSGVGEGFTLPDTVDQLFENYRVLRPQKFRKRSFNPIHVVTDIHAGVINATILSSLNCVGDKTSWSYQLFNIYQQYPDKLLRSVMSNSLNCVGDKTSWSYQLFNIYQQYPDKLLRSVMSKTRADQMVSLRKRYLRTHVRQGDYLPLSSSPYQLSISYINLLLTRYQYELYGDCLEMYHRLVDSSREADYFEEVVAAKGGIAACVVEFATQGKIDFKLDIPDQIIVMDPNVIQKDETYTRIVQRYQDILTKCKEPQVTMTHIFDDSYSSISQDTEMMEDELAVPAQNTLAKAATRIALYLTREECDKTMEQKEIQHAHDFFVVNATRVFCRFNCEFKDHEVPAELMPLGPSVKEDLLSRIKRLALFPGRNAPINETVTEICEILRVDRELVVEIEQLIKSKKEMGLTLDEIRDIYGVDKRVAEIINQLVDSQVILRSGVNKTHLVHGEFYRPWVIHSYRLLRLDRENIPENRKASCAMMMNVGENVPSDETTCAEPVDDHNMPGAVELGDDNLSNMSPPPLSPLPSLTEPTPSTSYFPPPLSPQPSTSSAPQPPLPDPAKSARKYKAKLLTGAFRKVEKATSFDAKSKCNLRVCVRPWIRINGSLNRRVLDKFLSSILGHVMIHPLCSLKNIQERFTPAFQPHHTRELVEMLAQLKCLKILALKRSHKCTLFSKPTEVSAVEATGLEPEEDILLEPDSMAVSRLAAFIGDSAYSQVIFNVDMARNPSE